MSGSGSRAVAFAVASLLLGCSTAGSTWVAEPMGAPAAGDEAGAFQPPAPRAPGARQPRTAQRIGVADPLAQQKSAMARAAPSAGRAIGTFRNTYYDFPEERDYEGEAVSLFSADCRPLARVPVGFHDAVCVQGSGLLENGHTVSFARRNCNCARRCPRTGQQICFDALDEARYPWGRGAAGQAIVPLLTVAVDSSVIPLGTSLFIPEYVGLPRDAAKTSAHDGCFIAQDRGIKVQGEHVDIFTGEEALTSLWNELVPSNRGVTVILDSPFCERAKVARD